MDLHFPEQLKKILLWQRVAFVTLTIFLVVVWAVSLYYMTDLLGFIRREGLNRDIYIGVFVLIGWLSALVAGTFINYILFQSISALQQYINTNEMRQLEMAFRKQKQFWMGLTLLVLGGVGCVIVLFLLATVTSRAF